MKTLNKLFLFLLIASFASCDVGDDEELNYGNGAYVAQFPFASKTGFFLKDDAATYDFTMPIEIVGGNGLALNTPVTITYEVDNVTTFDDDDDDTTPEVLVNTAVLGTNFDFVGSSTLVIPAGSTFSSIPLKVYSGTLDDQNPPRLLLKLTTVAASGANIVTSGNKGSVLLTLQGTCTSDLAGTYNTVTTRLSPAGGPYTVANEPIVETAAGTYLTSLTGNFRLASNPLVITGAWSSQTAPAPRSGYKFKEVCGRVAVEEQKLFDYFTNTVDQTPAQAALSTISPSGVITIHYQVNGFAAPNATRTYRSIYTPVP